MKNISKFIAITFITFASMTSISAQAADKIGYVNTVKLYQQLPQMKSLEQKLESQSKSKRSELDRLRKDIEAKVTKLNRDGKTMKANEVDNLRIDISSSQARLEVQAKTFNTEMAKLERDEMQKINEKIQTAIESVAKSGNYDLILNGQALAYAKDSADITEAVLKQIK